MQMLYVLFLGLAVSFDALLAGVTYGVKKITLPFTSLLVVGAVTAACTAAGNGRFPRGWHIDRPSSSCHDWCGSVAIDWPVERVPRILDEAANRKTTGRYATITNQTGQTHHQHPGRP